jgi:4-amino-4-deoxy-L-arabinose transferase-like glycosyltransferase
MNKRNLLLLLIIIIGIFFRFYRLTDVPPPLSHDETAIGYNAYSILKSGKDEYGIQFPLLFKSFDDYKLPGMVYSTVITVWLFGLNELAIRLPSALYGILSVFVFYYLAKEYLIQTIDNKKFDIPFLSTFMTGFFSFSLWQINFSRQNFESNGAVFFLMLAILFLIRFPIKSKSLIFSAIFFAVSIYFYYSVRLIIPFILLIFFITSWFNIMKNLKIVFLSVFCGLLVLSPFIPSLISPGGFERIKMVSITNDPNYLDRLEYNSLKIAENNNIYNRIKYNRRIALLATIGDNYLKNISYDQLFIKGAGRSGLLHQFEFPLIIIGLASLLIIKSPLRWIFIAWLISAPFPGAFSINQPNALRTLPGAPILEFISGLGFVSLYSIFKSTKYKLLLSVTIIILYIISFNKFYDSYFNKFPYDNPLEFADGQKQMVEYLKLNQNIYSKIIISGQYWRPYIFTLFWLKYDPQTYQKNGNISQFDKFLFGKASWDKSGILFSDPKTDIINLSDNPSHTLYVLSPIDYNAHKDQFRIIDTIDGLYVKSAYYATVVNTTIN